nr:hypothetical protein [Tanacetum cinerariifolium]
MKIRLLQRLQRDNVLWFLKIVREPVVSISNDTNSDRFTEFKGKKHKGKKAHIQPRSRQIDGIRLHKPKPNFYWQKKGTMRRGAINKVKGPSTSNSFDALNIVDAEEECGTSSSKGNQEEEQDAGLKAQLMRVILEIGLSILSVFANEVPDENGISYTKEVIKVEYEWRPPRCADCKIFGEPVVSISNDTNSDRFTEFKGKKHKGKKAHIQPWSRQID